MLPRVGFLGPAGTFSEEALLASAAADAVAPVAFATIYDTVVAVRRREVQWAVVPIENSLDGSVTVTLDLLAETGMRAKGECLPASVETGMRAKGECLPASVETGMRAKGECLPASVETGMRAKGECLPASVETGMRAKGECLPASVETGMRAKGECLPASVETGMRAKGECHPASVDDHGDLEIVGEVLLAVKHSLIAAQRVALSEIDTVISHPQVPGQCTRLLRGELAHARVLPASSTAEAVRVVAAEGVRGQAALGTRLAAAIYGATVVREGVQDHNDNVTRFVWLAQTGQTDDPPLRIGIESPPLGGWKTSVVFWGSGADSPGWLVRCLDEFAKRAINLTKIESRPQRARLGHYMFFVDLQGSVRERTVGEALEGLRAACEQVRVLGSYRAVADPST